MKIPTPAMTELLHAIDLNLERASKGKRDPEEMKRALKELTQGREEVRNRIGTVNIAVDLIREARNP